MPIQRVSKGFRDISASFQINPMNDDLIALKNENAIARSIRNLILTTPGEKPFQPEIGSRVSRLLFELMDQITATQIQSEIEFTINNFEPRVRLLDVVVTPDFDGNAFDCVITYEIIGIQEVQEITFVLVSAR